MPELSRFFGIIIRMYLEAGERHSSPHFHAYYQNSAAAVSIDTGDILAGSLPKRQERLVMAWAEIHQEELRVAWAALQAGRSPAVIPPLN